MPFELSLIHPGIASLLLVSNRSLMHGKDPYHKVDRHGKYEIQIMLFS